MHTRSRVASHIDQAFDDDPRLALTALRQLIDDDIPWIERTVIRNARSQGYDWARIGRLLGRSRQSVRKRYGEIDGTYEPIQFDALDLAAKLMADHKRGLAERERRRRFEAWAASNDVVAW